MASYSASTRPSNWCQRERRTGTDYYHTYAPLVHILWCSTGINRLCCIWTCLCMATQCMACWTQGGAGDWGEEQRVSGLISVVFKGAARENGRACAGESVQRSEASEILVWWKCTKGFLSTWWPSSHSVACPCQQAQAQWPNPLSNCTNNWLHSEWIHR